MTTNYASKAPKEKKSDKKVRKVYPGPYIGRLLNSLGDERVKRNDNHIWSGYLSPSNELAWDMCMDEVYDRMCKPSDVDESSEVIMFLGRALHEIFKQQSKWQKDFHYDFRDNMLPEFAEWQKKSWPEAVGRDNVSGWVYKADSVLAVPGEPGVADIVDLKSCYQFALKWDEFAAYKLPKVKDIIQVLIYADRFEALGLLPKVRNAVLDYFNVTNHLIVRGTVQYKTVIVPFDPFRYDIRLLIYHGAVHRRNVLLGTREPCAYPACRKHGTEESTAMERIQKYVIESRRVS